MASADSDPKQSLPSILVVDDDPDLRQLLVDALRAEEPRCVEAAASTTAAKASLLQRAFDVVITDLSMPEEGGLGLMQWAKEHCPRPSWIVLTGYGTFDSAVKALQLGAFDFLTKPLEGVIPLRNSVRNAIDHQRLLAERNRLHAELKQSNTQLREHVEQLEEACRLLREQADTIRADLHRAGLIQRALLPQAPPKITGLSVQALYRPSQNVGGDLYDVVKLDDRNLVLLIADAAGHGLSAAMLAVLFRQQLPLVDPDSGVPCHPCDALQAANRQLSDGFSAPGLFLTAAYCLVDLEKRTVRVASAGHLPLLLQRSSGAIERIFHTGPALGLYPDASFVQQEIVLEPGDRLLLHTDGLYERFANAVGSPSEKVAAALRGEAEHGPHALEHLLASSERLQPPSSELQDDDMTLLMLDAVPGPSLFDNGMPPPLPAAATVGSRHRFQILLGRDSRRTTLSIQGRADWARSAVFHQECIAAIETGRDLMLDLTLCEHLDSTFLGTIHELAERAERADVEFRLQGVMPPVEDLFQELGMERVMEHIVPVMLPLPTDMEPLVDSDRDPASAALRVLRAHEGLAALSDQNRREFDPLLALLRREIDCRTLP